MQKRSLIIPLALLFALALSACGGSADEGASEAVLTEAAQIAIDGLTQTAAAAPPTATPEPSATETPVPPTPTPEPTQDNSEAQAIIPTFTQQSAGSSTACLRANFEYENVPDGTQYPVGKVFTKTWRIKNTGSCTWTADYVLFWVEGDLMGANSVNPFTEDDIHPNEYAEININFQAPDHPGNYKGYWMLRGPEGIFGVGPDGKSWIWVDIEAYVPVD